ncbi:UDP-2,3-diacylglucosamine diphosphatase [bacterium]|nr:UDP-2,3-diacylglucosamine diphosphatase [candidate division CSSED10-310 bacterium]
MDSVFTFTGERVIFIADAHLHPDDQDRTARFLTMLRREAETADVVVILGDLFEFWFEYRRAGFLCFFDVLYELHRLHRAGKVLIYLSGNHDFLLGAFIRRSIGCQVFDAPIAVTMDDRSIYLAHGDQINPHDYGYRLLRRLTRHPATQWLFRLIHPDLGWRLAARVAVTSRSVQKKKSMVPENIYAAFLDARLEDGFAAVVHGHFHDFGERVHQRDGRTLSVITAGDWIEHFSWVRYADGRFSLHREREDGGDSPRIGTTNVN